MGGTPYTLRCPKCKKGENWRARPKPDSGDNIVATGLKRFNVKRPGSGRGEQAQVQHTTCGWTWWTFHNRFTNNPRNGGAPGA